MVPPAVWFVPNAVAVEITQQNGVASLQLGTVNLQVFPQLTDLAEYLRMVCFCPHPQHLVFVVQGKGQKQFKAIRGP